MKNWKIINTIEQIKQIKELSKTKAQLIYKHSTTCPVNADVKEKLEADFEKLTAQMDLYYLDLLAFRAISNQIAEEFGIKHQSPQVILIQNEKVIFHGSHYKFEVVDILKAI